VTQDHESDEDNWRASAEEWSMWGTTAVNEPETDGHPRDHDHHFDHDIDAKESHGQNQKKKNPDMNSNGHDHDLGSCCVVHCGLRGIAHGHRRNHETNLRLEKENELQEGQWRCRIQQAVNVATGTHTRADEHEDPQTVGEEGNSRSQ